MREASLGPIFDPATTRVQSARFAFSFLSVFQSTKDRVDGKVRTFHLPSQGTENWRANPQGHTALLQTSFVCNEVKQKNTASSIGSNEPLVCKSIKV